ncbi:MAG: Ig-like domain-containing protein [Pyrinomonadaceae bacterium]
MKYILAIVLNFLLLTGLFAQNTQNIVTTDIDNFWSAYDKIITTKDNAEQLEYLNKLFIEKGTLGLKGIMQAREYTPQEYVDAINKYPLFWKSIRENTLKAKSFAKEIEIGISRLKKLYPELKPANIYFTIGVLRTGGTTIGNNVLIGSEISLADENTDISELPENFNNLKTYFKSNPINGIVFANVHEFVHTQQKTTVCDNLLGQSVMEGVAEFLATKALETPSGSPAIAYGKSNEPKIKNAFAGEMFNPFYGFWLYSNAQNEFNTRDLGYYVGYTIAEKFYEKAKDKKLAVKEMIELDYNNPVLLAKYVDKSGYFPKSIKKYAKEFEKNRPRVINIKPFKNGDKKVSPNITELTVEFSKEMNKNFRNFEFGQLGKDASLKIKRVIGFSGDGKSISIEIEPLQANKHYQIVIGGGFRDKAGISLKPYLIDFTTANK